MTTREQLEEVLLPLGFKPISLNVPYLVYGKIVQKNICLRVYSYINPETGDKHDLDPFRLKFVRRDGGKIEKVASERRVFTHQLAPKVWQETMSKALAGWEMQLNQVDIPCEKCGCTGVYHWISKSGNACEGQCNRCSGQGFQDWNDRRKNFVYDRSVEAKASTGSDPDGENYSDWIPHWHPDPENFANPEWRKEAAKPRKR